MALLVGSPSGVASRMPAWRRLGSCADGLHCPRVQRGPLMTRGQAEPARCLERAPVPRSPGADVHLRDPIAVDEDARARASEAILVAALDHDFPGMDAPLEAQARFFSARLAQARRLDVFEPDALAVAAQRVAVERDAALAGPCGSCQQREQEKNAQAQHEPIVRFRASRPKAILRMIFRALPTMTRSEIRTRLRSSSTCATTRRSSSPWRMPGCRAAKPLF